MVHSQMVARHGSRGLTKPGPDRELAGMLEKAAAGKALTPQGQALREGLAVFIAANERLGAGDPNVTSPGYGNLTALGRREHQGLAERLIARVHPLLDDIARDEQSRVWYSLSGVDRADQSARAFLDTVRERVPGLSARVSPTPRVTNHPAPAPVQQAEGVDRYALYFHKLNAKIDLPGPDEARASTIYRRSQAYQAYQRGDALAARLRATDSRPELRRSSEVLVAQLVAPPFAASLDPLKVASALYQVCSISPLLRQEMGQDLPCDFGAGAFDAFAERENAESFYTKGPSWEASDGVTYRMAAQLLEDFLDASQDAADGRHAGATFRFAHAETVIPFAVLLGIPEFSTPTKGNAEFSSATNPWRVARAAPMAANVQWDTYRGPQGQVLVRMLYNERETDFKPACESARWKAGSHFYALQSLRTCYSGVWRASEQ